MVTSAKTPPLGILLGVHWGAMPGVVSCAVFDRSTSHPCMASGVFLAFRLDAHGAETTRRRVAGVSRLSAQVPDDRRQIEPTEERTRRDLQVFRAVRGRTLKTI